ncbi:MAG: hypothetical protein WCS14_04305 [Candidatus Methanomethylophilaceae archaeon]
MARITDDDLRAVALILISGDVKPRSQAEAAEILDISVDRLRRIQRLLVKEEILTPHYVTIYICGHSKGPEWTKLFPEDSEYGMAFCKLGDPLWGYI